MSKILPHIHIVRSQVDCRTAVYCFEKNMPPARIQMYLPLSLIYLRYGMPNGVCRGIAARCPEPSPFSENILKAVKKNALPSPSTQLYCTSIYNISCLSRSLVYGSQSLNKSEFRIGHANLLHNAYYLFSPLTQAPPLIDGNGHSSHALQALHRSWIYFRYDPSVLEESQDLSIV
jgi:hypothetical protein